MKTEVNLSAPGPSKTSAMQKADAVKGGKPGFADVFKGLTKKHPNQELAESSYPADQQLLNFQLVPALAPDEQSRTGRQIINASDLKTLLASLSQEVAARVSAEGSDSVSIQFESRTLDGLHVQIKKTSDALQITFSTASQGVSQLLAQNSAALTAALVQRGYVAPVVTIQPLEPRGTQSARAATRGDSRGERGRQGSRR